MGAPTAAVTVAITSSGSLPNAAEPSPLARITSVAGTTDVAVVGPGADEAGGVVVATPPTVDPGAAVAVGGAVDPIGTGALVTIVPGATDVVVVATVAARVVAADVVLVDDVVEVDSPFPHAAHATSASAHAASRRTIAVKSREPSRATDYAMRKPSRSPGGASASTNHSEAKAMAKAVSSISRNWPVSLTWLAWHRIDARFWAT